MLSSDDKIIGRWTFDEASDRLDDASEYDNDALLRGDVAAAPDGSISLDGSGDYVEIPNIAEYGVTHATIEVSFSVDALGGSQTIVSRDTNGYDDGGHFTMRVENDGSLWVHHQSDSQSYYITVSDPKIVAGQDYTLTYSFGPEKGMELYLDGTLVGSNDAPVTDGADISLGNNSEPWTLGANQWGSSNGAADNLMHYLEGPSRILRFIRGS